MYNTNYYRLFGKEQILCRQLPIHDEKAYINNVEDKIMLMIKLIQLIVADHFQQPCFMTGKEQISLRILFTKGFASVYSINDLLSTEVEYDLMIVLAKYLLIE